jgi:ligand-binding sensor domain-containing protein
MASRFNAAAFAVLMLVAGTASASSRAGLVSFRRVAIPDEVPAHLTTALAQDRQGFLWIGTQAGLVRFDGSRFEVFRSNPEDPATLLVDRTGQVWIGGRGGLQAWRGEGKGFERIASDPGEPGSLAGELVVKLFEDDRGRIWIGTTEHGAAVLDPRTGRLQRLLPQPAPDGLSHFWVYGFAQARPDEVWIATFGGGVDVVDPASLKVIDRLRHDPATRAFRVLRYSPDRPDGLTHPEVVRALQTRDGTIWVGTDSGLNAFDPKLGKAIRISFSFQLGFRGKPLHSDTRLRTPTSPAAASPAAPDGTCASGRAGPASAARARSQSGTGP